MSNPVAPTVVPARFRIRSSRRFGGGNACVERFGSAIISAFGGIGSRC
jgi:hypothetical protein